MGCSIFSRWLDHRTRSTRGTWIALVVWLVGAWFWCGGVRGFIAFTHFRPESRDSVFVAGRSGWRAGDRASWMVMALNVESNVPNGICNHVGGGWFMRAAE